VTDYLIRRLARRPLVSLARPSVVAAFAFPLAYAVGLWMNVLHGAEGGHERGEPPPVIHWLRDSTLALPVVFAAVWLAVVLSRRVIQRHALESRPAVAGAVLATYSAFATACSLAFANPLHSTLFAAHHGGHDLPFALHLVRDGLLALALALPVAGIVACALVRTRPWAPPQVATWLVRGPRKQRLAAQALIVMVAVVPIALGARETGGALAAGATPGNPCPADASTKSFDVRAIDVNIPYNRFGEHDPLGKMYVLSSRVDAVRAEEATQHVSVGLREDPIQPLVIRANEGDCVEINFTNNASGGPFGMHIDGVAFDVGSSGDRIGANADSTVARGRTITYRYYLPEDPTVEGAHYIRPGPGNREAVAHGLFGALVAEPPGSRYTEIEHGTPIESGWQANVIPGDTSKKAFREYVQMYHEVGDEKFRIPDGHGSTLPVSDPHTDSYRPGSRAMNYRSEPFMNRLDQAPEQDSLGYSSYPFGDPATIVPRGYQGDPTKMRIIHAGSEMFHVFHLHGGGIRWRYNPVADHTYDYQDTGLNKHPKTQLSPSTRLDSQAFGPGESYNLEIEGGAGGVQQGAGEFLFHCHIAEHYISGMWGFWRVYDTKQPDLSVLPDREALPAAVTSQGLIGRTYNGTEITAANVDDWIRPQLPPQGVRRNDQDAAVWNWAVDNSDAANGPLYLGEPEDNSAWPDFKTPADDNDPNNPGQTLPGHPSLFPNDVIAQGAARPAILFDPRNGRPAFPLLRPHLGQRNPFSPNGHSGAPWLGENGDTPVVPGKLDPFAGRPDGICPAGAPVRTFNVVAIQTRVPVTTTTSDPNGRIFVLAQDKNDVLAGRKPAQPLAIRANIGDCVAVTLTSEQQDNSEFPFTKVNMHIHHVQFDTQASDGVITGLSFEQSVRPHQIEDPNLAAAAAKGATTLRLTSVAKFQNGEYIAVGEGRDSIEIHKITAINATARTVTIDAGLTSAHASGEGAGVEFTQYRWYPDVQLDNIFWHDHVDGIHSWGHGLVGQLIVEPRGSTYHDPQTGGEVKSGTIVDIHTSDPLAPGLVEGSFRELALWTLDENKITDSTLNLRATPWAPRLAVADPSLLFSSYRHGDPNTPLPRAYPGDPFVIRTINVGPTEDAIHVDGHRFFWENRFSSPDSASPGPTIASPVDTLHDGISERFTLILQGGAGGPLAQPGDYLYNNTVGRRFRQGAWGILRVLSQQSSGLAPLPDHPAPAGGSPLPSPTGAAPPQANGPGDPCPGGADQVSFDVSAVDVPGGTVTPAVPPPLRINKDNISTDVGPTSTTGVNAAFVRSSDASAVAAGTKKPEPLVLHVAQGDCVTVKLHNERTLSRASFHASGLLRTIESSGIDVGFNPEQTVAPGDTREYRFFADTDRLQSTLISDFGAEDSGVTGLYGAFVVAEPGARFTNPTTGADTNVGTQVDVHLPDGDAYRDFTVIASDNDPQVGASDMPYPIDVVGPTLINYLQARVPRTNSAAQDGGAAFASVNGDPRVPVLRAYRGDPMRVHVLGAPGNEQIHVLNLGGLSWPIDSQIPNADRVANRAFGATEKIDAHVEGGAGGGVATGDVFFGDLRRPFTQGGIWGLQRVFDPSVTRADLQPLK
jgi:FtsP/CotA-like multicopper oxidase with cupredoxin domain